MNPQQQDRVLLRSMMRGELAAADCYERARQGCLFEGLEERELLRRLAQKHELRARAIHCFLVTLGEQGDLCAGAWGQVTRCLQWLAAVGTTGAQGRLLSLLFEGEKFGMCQYESQLQDLSKNSRRFVEEQLMGAQEGSLWCMEQWTLCWRREAREGQIAGEEFVTPLSRQELSVAAHP